MITDKFSKTDIDLMNICVNEILYGPYLFEGLFHTLTGFEKNEVEGYLQNRQKAASAKKSF